MEWGGGRGGRGGGGDACAGQSARGCLAPVPAAKEGAARVTSAASPARTASFARKCRSALPSEHRRLAPAASLPATQGRCARLDVFASGASLRCCPSQCRTVRQGLSDSLCALQLCLIRPHR